MADGCWDEAKTMARIAHNTRTIKSVRHLGILSLLSTGLIARQHWLGAA
jgi:hypothetical protein